MAGPSAASRAQHATQIRQERAKAKVVLKEFREHYDELEKDKDEALDCRSAVLSQHFVKAESNAEKAHTVDQAYIDAQIFHRLGQYSRRQAAQLQTGLKDYDVKSFVDSLVLVMQKTASSRTETFDDLDNPTATQGENGELSMSFLEIGESVWNRWKTAPSIEFMYGNAPAEDGEKPAPQRKKGKRVKKGGVAVAPTLLEKGDVDQTETDKQVAAMKAELKRRGRENFWKFVVDPDPKMGYTRTVENIFHAAFLIKDMYARLDLRVEPPIFEYTDPSAQATIQETGAKKENSQFVMGFDQNLWRTVIGKYRISESMLPLRRSSIDVQDPQMARLRRLEAQVQQNGYGEESEGNMF